MLGDVWESYLTLLPKAVEDKTKVGSKAAKYGTVRYRCGTVPPSGVWYAVYQSTYVPLATSSWYRIYLTLAALPCCAVLDRPTGKVGRYSTVAKAR